MLKNKDLNNEIFFAKKMILPYKFMRKQIIIYFNSLLTF